MKYMLKPLVMHASLSVRVSEQQGEGTMLALQNFEKSHEEQSTPSQVYRKLLQVLKTLHSHLLGNIVKSEDAFRMHFSSLCQNTMWLKSDVLFMSDVSIGDKKLSAILGELIWEEMSQCIIHECLVYSIPANSNELEKYVTVCIKTTVLYVNQSWI